MSYNVACPTTCEAALPVVSFSLCSPEVNGGEISQIFIGKADEKFTDVKSLTEWNTKLTPATGTATLKTLIGVGDKAKPGTNVLDISRGRKVILNRDHSITFTIDETNTVNHEMLRKLECGGTFKIWYTTADSRYVFGGNTGITVTVDPGMIIPRGVGELQTYELIFSWKHKFTEPKDLFPLAAPNA